jgi:DNA end-binding protein Ku
LRKPDDNSTDTRDAAGRPIWSGTITFGLVSIPVNLFPANRDSRVSLRMLGPKGEPLKRDYYSSETGADVESTETIRGFQTENGKYVTVTEEELERLAPEKSRDISLRVFVPRKELSPLYFQRGYVLTPADKSGKAYRLLAKTMEALDRAGVATFVMHGKEYLVAILAVEGILRAETLRFGDEIRTPLRIGLPKKKEKISAKIVKTIDAVIARLSRKTLDLKEMRDEYAEGMLKLIEKKRTHHKDVVKAAAPRKGPAEVVDLMEVLKRNLEQGRKSTRSEKS